MPAVLSEAFLFWISWSFSICQDVSSAISGALCPVSLTLPVLVQPRLQPGNHMWTTEARPPRSFLLLVPGVLISAALASSCASSAQQDCHAILKCHLSKR